MSDFSSLSYSTYHDPSSLGSDIQQPAMFIGIDYDLTDGDNSWQGNLWYEPYLTPGNSPVKGTWQTWNTLIGLWWGSTFQGTLFVLNPIHVRLTP